LFEAAKSLNWTHIRADIMECTEAEARLWEAMENLYRTELTVLEQAEHQAECVRLIAERESVSRQNVAKPKDGRPEGAIAKAARELPMKGKTQQARRKAIERGLKIAAISSEAKVAVTEAGLDDNRSALHQIASQNGAKAQVAKAREIAARMGQKGLPRGTATKKRKPGGKEAAPEATSGLDEPVDKPAGGSPPTVPEIGAGDATAAEIEQLKAELAKKTENLREAREELQQARRAAARAPERAATSPLSPAASDDDLEIPATLDRRPLSGEDQAIFAALVTAWSNALEFQRAFANASAVVRERFIAEILRGDPQGNSERQV
jgi:hypothetical protein